MEFEFNPDLFNDLYWHLKEDLKNPLIRFIWMYGGSSASKTYTYVQSDITALLENKDENVMVLRKYGVDIKDSIYSDYVKIITDWGLNDYFKCQINYIECLEDPHNRVLDACNEFKTRYPIHEVSGLFIYGDRTSIKEDTKMEKGENFFTKIQQYLSGYSHKLRMQRRNPSVAQSGAFINEIYRTGYKGISISIGSNCKKSLFDYQYALEDSDGTIKKTKKKNPTTGVTYEEFGHCSDTKRYLITVAFEKEYNEYIGVVKKKKIIW